MRADPRRVFAQPASARHSKVSHAAAKSARERLPEHLDQRADVSDAAYQLLVAEGGPLLLALASADPAVSGAAMGRMRALSRRYARLVSSELARLDP